MLWLSCVAGEVGSRGSDRSEFWCQSSFEFSFVYRQAGTRIYGGECRSPSGVFAFCDCELFMWWLPRRLACFGVSRA